MTNTTKTLGDVLYDFALAMPVPDPNVLDDYTRLYPEFADALTDFAVQRALDPAGEDDDDDGVPADTMSPAVARAVSHFQNLAFELEAAAGNAGPAVNPFASLSRQDFNAFAARLGGNQIFAIKIRDRQIEPDTIISRRGFCTLAADALGVPVGVMNAHMLAPQTMAAHQRFKADEKPTLPRRETFEEAVRNSGLTAEQQKRLMEV